MHRMVVLSLASGAPYGSYATIAETLEKSGMTVIPDSTADGSCLLRVSGYKHPEQVEQLLRQQGITPQKIAADPSMDMKLRTLDRLKNRSLSVAGITYLLGDISLFISGMMSGQSKEALAGLSYASGGLVSAVYGNPSDARQVKNVAVHLGDFLVSQGADIPNDSMLKDAMSGRRGGIAEKAENFIYRHPSEVHNLIYAIGGTQLLRSGLQKRTVGTAGGWEDMAAGGLVTAGGLAGSVIPEKHDEHSKGLRHWIQEKPLRLAGYLYTLNNAFLIKGGWQEYKANPKQKSYIFKFATAGFFLIANAFMSMTSRSHDANSAGAEDRRHIVEGIAAEAIAAQPEAERVRLTRQVAGFLSTQPETKQDKAVLEASLMRKVAALENSPWFLRPQPPDTSSHYNAQTQTRLKPHMKNWADRTIPDPNALIESAIAR